MTDLANSVNRLNENFIKNPRSVEESITYLQKLEKLLDLGHESLANALKADFNRSTFETFSLEYALLKDELKFTIKNIKTMLKASPQGPISPFFSTINLNIEKIALGTILVISPFNYPLTLAISPFIGAFASGNNVVLKLPGDQLPNFTHVLKELLENIFDKNHVLVVCGGINESTTLINEKFDKIFFTGSTRVGKVIHEAAAKTLTPVVLELGGKSPVFVTKSVPNLKIVVKRLLWGKFTNSGQTCVAPDYVLVDSTVYEEFMQALETEFNSSYKDVTSETDFTHLINDNAYNRLSSYLATTRGNIISNDSSSSEKRFLAPSIVTNVDWEDSLMKDEIFGPILPVLKYDSLEDAVSNVIKYHDTPLTLYILGNNEKEIESIKRIRSGSLAINEFLMVAGCHSSPFGGIGNSGFGNYHSKWSVGTFTHERAIMKQPMWSESLISSRYFPYTNAKFSQMSLLGKLPDLPIINYTSIFTILTIFAIGLLIGRYYL